MLPHRCQFSLPHYVHWPTQAPQPDDTCTVRVCADTLQDDSKSEELKSAASVALGGLTTGAVGAYLPTLLSAAASQVTCHVVCDNSMEVAVSVDLPRLLMPDWLSTHRQGQHTPSALVQAAKPKVQFLLLAALNEALTSLAAPGANPSSLSAEQRDQVPCH